MGINEAAGRRESVLSTRGNLGMVLRQLGLEGAAEEHLLAALGGYRRGSNPHGELSSLDELSQLYAHATGGEAEDALRCLSETLDLAQRHGYPYFAARAQVALAGVHLSLGAHQLARDCARHGRELAAAHDFRVVEASALAALARCLAAVSSPEASAAVQAAVAAYRATGAVALADRLADRLGDRPVVGAPAGRGIHPSG